MYLDNARLRKIAKWQKVSHTLIIYWIKQFGHIVQEILDEEVKTLEKTDVEVIEVDEFCIYIKKPQNGGKYSSIWLAVDRNCNKICDFEIGDRSFATYYKLAEGLKRLTI